MSLAILSFERIRFECENEVLCARCQAPLDRHQPDPYRPDKLLGTCYECGTWYLMDGRDRVMMPLPDMEIAAEA